MRASRLSSPISTGLKSRPSASVSQLNHTAATPPGFTVTVKVELVSMEGKKLTFAIEASDGVDRISKGTHERFVVNAGKFNAAVADKRKKHLF